MASLAQALFAQSPLSTIVYDPDGRIVAANAAFERLFGVRAADIPATYSVLTDPALDAQGVLPLVRRAFDGEAVTLPPLRYGPVPEIGVTTRTWTQAHLSPLRDADDRLTHVALVHVDVTAHVEAREALAASEARLRLALDAADAGAWEWDVQANRVRWSEALERMHGIPVGSFGGTFADYERDIHPDDRALVVAQVERTLAGEPHRLDYRIVRPDGAVRWLRAFGLLVRDPTGAPARLVGICTDVTDERREAALAADIARLNIEIATQARDTRAILESITDPFVVYDAAWRLRYVNDAARAVFRDAGTPGADAALGASLWEAYPDLVDTALGRALRRAMETREPVAVEGRRDLTGHWAEVRCYPMPDGGLATTWRDVTARRRAAEAEHFLAEATALLASSLDYERTLGALADLVVPRLADWCRVDMTTDDGGIRPLVVVHADPSKVAYAREIERRFPTDPNEEAGGVGHVIRTGEPQLVPLITAEMLEGGIADAEYLRVVRALGLRSVLIVPLAARGRVLGALTLIAAESDRRYDDADLHLATELARRAALAVDNARLHQAALDAERRAAAANLSKTQFLASMSHELRTPLNAIGGYTDLLLLGIRGPITAAQREDLERVARSQRHLLSVINDILNFARVEAGHVEYVVRPVAVRDLLADVEPLVAPQLAAKSLATAWDAGDDGLHAVADPEKVRQILLNLLANAAKFTAPGGRVWVSAEPRDGAVAIRVRDTGIGIPADRLEQIFEPFVQVSRTLASPTEGTGLGLAISRDLARGMGGDIAVDSALGTGSTFTVTLPRA